MADTRPRFQQEKAVTERCVEKIKDYWLRAKRRTPAVRVESIVHNQHEVLVIRSDMVNGLPR